MKKKVIIVTIVVLLLSCVSAGGYFYVQQNHLTQTYEKAVAFMNEEDYGQAIPLFETVAKYKDADALAEECRKKQSIQEADSFFNAGNYENAMKLYEQIGLTEKVDECVRKEAEAYVLKEEYEKAIPLYQQIGEEKKANDCTLKVSEIYIKKKDYEKALSLLESIRGYRNADELIQSTKYKNAIGMFKSEHYDQAKNLFSELGTYRHSQDYVSRCMLARKYEKIDFQNNTQFYIADTEEEMRSWTTEEKIQNELESWLSNDLYLRWYAADSSGSELEISAYKIDGKEYGISKYIGDFDAQGRYFTTIEYYFFDAPEKKYELRFEQDRSYARIGEWPKLLTYEGKYYLDITPAQVAVLDQKLDESYQPKNSKESVYAIAQQDAKNFAYTAGSGRYTLDNIFDAVAMAGTISIDFESIDTVQYDFNMDTRVHTIVFYMTASYRYGLGELYGSGNGSTVRLVAQYQEDDSGNLTRIELYRVE